MIRRFEPVEPTEYGPRAGVIHLDGRDIQTPSRVLNSSESRYKTKGITWKPYPNQVLEYVRNFDDQRLSSIRRRNGMMANEVKEVRSVLKKNADRLSFFCPRIPGGTIVTEADIRTLLDLQGLAQLSLISIPDSSGLSPEDFDSRVDRGREFVERTYPRRECFPVLELREEADAFRQKLQVALDAGFRLIGLRFAPFTSNYANYRTLTASNREEVWFHLHEVPRFWRSDYTTAQIHVAPFAGVDTMSLDAPRGGPQTPGTADSVKRFDPGSLGHLTKPMHREMYGQDLGCLCPLCEGKTLDDFYRDYLIGPRSRRPSVPRLRQHTAVHEVFASHRELQVWRENFIGGEIQAYVASRRYLRNALADIGLLPSD